MEELFFYLLMGTSFGAVWLQRARLARRLAAARPRLSDDAEVVLHLARHQASDHPGAVAPVHILFALVQDAGIAEAIRQAGGDVEALEDRLFSAVDEAAAGDADVSVRLRDTRRLLGWALSHAARGTRNVTTTDLWGGLVCTAPDVAALVEQSSGVGAASVLFTLVHGIADEVPGGGGGDVRDARREGDVEVVLINDDITTMDLVVEVLATIFELPEERATRRMRETHEQGASVVGRFSAADAASRAKRARDLARSRGYPLRLQIQPAI